MNISDLLNFIAIMAIFVAIPGAGTFLVTSVAIQSGKTGAFITALGISLGDIIYLLFAIFGWLVISQRFENIVYLVKFIGSMYLIYLGIKVFSSPQAFENIEFTKSKNFCTGFFVSITNPKVILFHLSILPLFLDLKYLTTSDIVLVLFTAVFVIMFVLFGYALIAQKIKDILIKKDKLILLDKISGIIIVVVGILMLLK